MNRLAQTIADRAIGGGVKSLGVLSFTDLTGRTTDLGRLLAEELTLALVNTGANLELYDQIHLGRLLAERGMASEDLQAPETMQKLGELANVQALVTGTLERSGGEIRLFVKIISAKSGGLIGGVRGSIEQTEGTDHMESASGDLLESTAEPAAKEMPAIEQTAGGVRFRVERCEKTGSGVLLTLSLASIGADRVLLIHRRDSFAIDEKGNQHLPVIVTVGNQRSKSTGVKPQLVADVSTESTFLFEGISFNVIKLLHIQTGIANSNHKVRLRDIPVRE